MTDCFDNTRDALIACAKLTDRASKVYATLEYLAQSDPESKIIYDYLLSALTHEFGNVAKIIGGLHGRE